MSTYNFKIVDYTVTNQGFLFKVLFLNNTKIDSYKFIFVPYALYTSILLVDFYLGRKSSDAVIDFIIEALKNDLSANEIVIIDSEKELRQIIKSESLLSSKSKVRSYNHISYITANRYSLKNLNINRNKFKGNRKNYSNFYKSFYNRSAERFNVFGGFSINKVIGERYSTFHFNVINNHVNAWRNRLFELIRIKELFSDKRYHFHNTGVDALGSLIRYSLKNLSAEEIVSELERMVFFDLNVLDTSGVFSRSKTKDLAIINFFEKSIKQKLRDLYFSDYILSTKSIINPLFLTETLSNSIKNIIKATELIDNITEFYREKKYLSISKEYFKAKLKVRQYPAVLERVGFSYKDKIHLLEQYFLYKSIKDIARDLNILDYQTILSKDISKEAKLLFSDILIRDINHDLLIERFNNVLKREIKHKLFLVESSYNGVRDNQSELFLFKETFSTSRNEKNIIYSPLLFSSFRDNVHELFLTNSVNGIRQIIYSLIYEDGLFSTRIKDFITLIGGGKSSYKKPHTLILDKSISGNYLNNKVINTISLLYGDKSQKELVLTKIIKAIKKEKSLDLLQEVSSIRDDKDLILSFLRRGLKDVKSLLLSPLSYGLKDVKSLILDKTRESQKVRERSIHVYDNLLFYLITGGYYERLLLEGILLDDMYFGDKQVTFSEILFEVIGQKNLSGVVLDEQYLSEINEKVSVLEESGLLSKDNESGGLLVFNIEAIKDIFNIYQEELIALGLIPERVVIEDKDNIQGEELFRDVELVIENPYGYLEKKAFFNESVLQGNDIFREGFQDNNYKLSNFILYKSIINNGLISSLIDNRTADINDLLFNSLKKITNFDNLTKEYLADLININGMVSDLTFNGNKINDNGILDDGVYGSLLDKQVFDIDNFGWATLEVRDTEFNVVSFGEKLLLEAFSNNDTLGAINNRYLYNIENIIAEVLKNKGIINQSTLAELDKKKANFEQNVLAKQQADESVLLEEEFTESKFIERFSNILINFIFMRNNDKQFEIFKDLIEALPEKYGSVLEEYLLSKEKEKLLHDIGESVIAKKFSEGLLKDEIIADKVSDGFIDTANELGQGFVFLYDKDVLFEDNNLEKWIVGYGIPADYDPSDPLNYYFSWSDVKDYYQLINEEWVQFDENLTDKGKWVINKNKFWFKSIGNQNSLSGLYRNVFNSSDYMFTFDFIVEDEPENAVGAVFKFIDENNYYRFKIFSDSIQNSLPMVLERVENGKVISYGTPMNPFNFKPNQLYKVKILVYDGRIKIWVNNILQYDFTE